MATTNNYLVLFTGSLEIDIMLANGDPTDYTLKYGSWAPNIAQPHTEALGAPYTSVWEEWVLNIRGSTPAIARQNLNLLLTMLERGWRWWKKRGITADPDAPLYVFFQPKGSDLSTALCDLIIDYDVPTLPGDYVAVGDFYWIRDVKIKFLRKNGIWLPLAYSNTQSSAATAQPGPIAVSLAITDRPHPIRALFTVSATPKTTACSGVIAFVGGGGSQVLVVEGASSGTAAAAYFIGTTSTVDTTNVATNGRVGRITATTTEASLTTTGISMTSLVDYVAYYISVKNTSTTVDCIFRLEFTVGANTVVLPEVTIRAVNPANPQVVFLGMLPYKAAAITSGNILLYYRSTSGSITLDIDQMLILPLDQYSTVLTVSGVNPTAGIDIDHRMTTHQQPAVVCTSIGGYVGSPYVLEDPIVTNLHAYCMLVQGQYWQIVNNAGTAAVNLTLEARRWLSYLTPE